MDHLILTRFAFFDHGTFGRLTYENESYWTVERPWLNNKPFESCIPNGYYIMGKVDSPRYGKNTWSVLDVPERTHILVHVANYPRELSGCIAVGEWFFPNFGGVTNSRKTLKRLHEQLEGKDRVSISIRSGEL